jgi:hypothetical protein
MPTSLDFVFSDFDSTGIGFRDYSKFDVFLSACPCGSVKRDKLFRGLWLTVGEWVRAVRDSVLEQEWPLEIIPVKAINLLSKPFSRKLPSWSSRRWKSKT